MAPSPPIQALPATRLCPAAATTRRRGPRRPVAAKISSGLCSKFGPLAARRGPAAPQGGCGTTVAQGCWTTAAHTGTAAARRPGTPQAPPAPSRSDAQRHPPPREPHAAAAARHRSPASPS